MLVIAFFDLPAKCTAYFQSLSHHNRFHLSFSMLYDINYHASKHSSIAFVVILCHFSSF